MSILAHSRRGSRKFVLEAAISAAVKVIPGVINATLFLVLIPTEARMKQSIAAADNKWICVYSSREVTEEQIGFIELQPRMGLNRFT